jgi:hypothetical protein
MSVAANVLGLANAATPLGIKAMVAAMVSARLFQRFFPYRVVVSASASEELP